MSGYSGAMRAPQKFADWMCTNIANDKKFGRSVFRYHPRSDEHSKKLCTLLVEDLLASSPIISRQASEGTIAGGVNMRFTFTNGKKKNLDLGIGYPAEATSPSLLSQTLVHAPLKELLIGCEAKQCMTEHSKTKPRLFDELSSSHEIVHQGDTRAIAAGLVVVNIAERYASPTRQTADGPIIFSTHKQPAVTESMIQHLRGLVMRDDVGQVGFDAFAIIVVDCDNVGECKLHVGPPAPQPGDPLHYETFLSRIISAYERRFA